MFKEVKELLSFVDQCPDALIGSIWTTISVRAAVLDFAGCLLTQSFSHDMYLSSRHCVGDESVAPFLDVTSDLVEVLSRLRKLLRIKFRNWRGVCRRVWSQHVRKLHSDLDLSLRKRCFVEEAFLNLSGVQHDDGLKKMSPTVFEQSISGIHCTFREAFDVQRLNLDATVGFAVELV